MSADLIQVDLEMSEEQEESVPLSNEKLAEERKAEGNNQYKLKNYRKALVCYDKAIELCPDNASYYGNRSACYLMLGNYSLALADAVQSVSLDQKFQKGWVRVIKCNIALGDIAATENAISKAKTLGIEGLNSDIESFKALKRFDEEAKKAFDNKDYRKVTFCLDRALQYAPSSARYKTLKSECLAHLGRYQEAQELANEVLGMDKQNADAILVRGICFYFQDGVDKAVNHFQHVLKLAPDHTNAKELYKKAKILKQKKEEGNAAFNAGKNLEAHTLYTEALAIDPKNVAVNAKLHFNRATVSSKLGNISEAIKDCTEALTLDPTYLKALLRRAKCYSDLQQYEEAVHDYKHAYQIDKSREIRNMLSEAELELKKSQRKDYYKILGVDKNASTEDIKKAYRKRALVYHPDRHAHASEGEKKEQEKKFKEVGEAYGILSDPQKRVKYDNGQDLDIDFGGMGGGMGGMPGFPTMFQTFFDDDAHIFTQHFNGNTFSFKPK